MRIRSRQHPAPSAKINVTPLIDVVMVLIIFYLIVGKLAADARVNLPTSGTGDPAEGREPVVVTLGPGDGEDLAHPRLLVNGVETKMESLANVLQARIAGRPEATQVQVRADRRLPFGAVAPIVKACREAGLTSVRLGTQRQEGGQ